MKYLELLTKLAKAEKSYQYYDEIVNLLEYPTEFEEIPLITRTGREKPFSKILPKEKFNAFFLNTAIYYINNIKLMAKDILIDNDLSLCITYPDINSELHDLYGFYVPNICIFRSKYKKDFEKNQILNLDKFSWLNESLLDLNYKDFFNIVYSKFDDGFGHEIFRIFLLYRDKASVDMS